MAVKTTSSSTRGPGTTIDQFPQNSAVSVAASVVADTLTLIRSNSPHAPQDQIPASTKAMLTPGDSFAACTLVYAAVERGPGQNAQGPVLQIAKGACVTVMGRSNV
jgi:hypothetical protein